MLLTTLQTKIDLNAKLVTHDIILTSQDIVNMLIRYFGIMFLYVGNTFMGCKLKHKIGFCTLKFWGSSSRNHVN